MAGASEWAAARLGYAFRDPALLDAALTHRSAGKVNYERLEFLGDAVLNFAVAVLLFGEYPLIVRRPHRGVILVDGPAVQCHVGDRFPTIMTGIARAGTRCENPIGFIGHIFAGCGHVSLGGVHSVGNSRGAIGCHQHICNQRYVGRWRADPRLRQYGTPQAVAGIGRESHPGPVVQAVVPVADMLIVRRPHRGAILVDGPAVQCHVGDRFPTIMTGIARAGTRCENPIGFILPSTRGLGLLLIVYVLLVGPANYLLLRWRKRLHWAWITMPAITIAFSAGAFGLGYALRGSDLILNKIAIIELQSDGTAAVTSYLGLFSPSRQSYEIQVPGEGLLSPLNPDYDP